MNMSIKLTRNINNPLAEYGLLWNCKIYHENYCVSIGNFKTSLEALAWVYKIEKDY